MPLSNQNILISCQTQKLRPRESSLFWPAMIIWCSDPRWTCASISKLPSNIITMLLEHVGVMDVIKHHWAFKSRISFHQIFIYYNFGIFYKSFFYMTLPLRETCRLWPLYNITFEQKRDSKENLWILSWQTDRKYEILEKIMCFFKYSFKKFLRPVYYLTLL